MFEVVIEYLIKEVMLVKWCDITDYVIYTVRGCIFVYFVLDGRSNNVIISEYMKTLILMSGYSGKYNVSTFF
jgi:hypothetical protein